MNAASKLSFPELAAKLKPLHFRGTLICFDPGETTGLAIFRNGRLAETSQLITKTRPQGIQVVNDLFASIRMAVTDRIHEPMSHPVRVVMEDYKIYGWKTDTHAWADLHTPKFIGSIEALCYIYNIPYHLQMAQQAKGFVDDTKLKAWGYYDKGERHARDAVRHGAYYTLFNEQDFPLSPPFPQ